MNQIVPALTANGTSCPEQRPIVGVLLSHATVGDRCNRIDVFYCSTAVSGLAEGIRVDRDPRECFNADKTSNCPISRAPFKPTAPFARLIDRSWRSQT